MSEILDPGRDPRSSLHLHTLRNRLAESCTYMTLTEDGALLPIRVAAPLLRKKTPDSCRAPYHQTRQHTVLPEREHAQNVKPIFHPYRLLDKPIYYAVITANFTCKLLLGCGFSNGFFVGCNLKGTHRRHVRIHLANNISCKMSRNIYDVSDNRISNV